jgi:hypothetical protein
MNLVPHLPETILSLSSYMLELVTYLRESRNVKMQPF